MILAVRVRWYGMQTLLQCRGKRSWISHNRDHGYRGTFCTYFLFPSIYLYSAVHMKSHVSTVVCCVVVVLTVLVVVDVVVLTVHDVTTGDRVVVHQGEGGWGDHQGAGVVAGGGGRQAGGAQGGDTRLWRQAKTTIV